MDANGIVETYTLKCGFGTLKRKGNPIYKGFFKDDKPYKLGFYHNQDNFYYFGGITPELSITA